MGSQKRAQKIMRKKSVARKSIALTDEELKGIIEIWRDVGILLGGAKRLKTSIQVSPTGPNGKAIKAMLKIFKTLQERVSLSEEVEVVEIYDNFVRAFADHVRVLKKSSDLNEKRKSREQIENAVPWLIRNLGGSRKVQFEDDLKKIADESGNPRTLERQITEKASYLVPECLKTLCGWSAFEVRDVQYRIEQRRLADRKGIVVTPDFTGWLVDIMSAVDAEPEIFKRYIEIQNC